MIKKSALLVPALALGAGIAFTALSTESNAQGSTEKSKQLNVLYVTQEPGTYHAYTPQREIFEQIAKNNNWKLKVISGRQNEVEEILATTPDFAKGADVVVYNFCMADSRKLNAPYNIIQTTKVEGIPALLIHGAHHSFWATYKNGSEHVCGQPVQVKSSPELIAQWKEAHPGVEFPAWSSFTGIASTAHGPRKSLSTKMLTEDHEIFNGFQDYITTDKAELYNNFVTAKDAPTTTPLLEGTQDSSKAIILWEHPVGKSKTVSFTLGHDTAEWSQKEFQTIITNSVNYLAKDKK